MTQPSKHLQLDVNYKSGKNDDSTIPEVISPLPQRIMPEVPSNMQEGLAHLELQARHESILSEKNFRQLKRTDSNILAQKLNCSNGYDFTNQILYQNLVKHNNQPQSTRSLKPSNFPKIQKPPPNLPLSDEDKGDFLENVRYHILKSTDPEVQLAWAQDALTWVEIENEFAIRTAAESHSTRSINPMLQQQLQEDALSIVKHLGDQGHPKAQFIKAYWLEFGKFDYQMNKKEAFLGYIRAAEKGFARAQYRIGMQYENSNNHVKAIDNYSKGVALKDSASHYRLGMMTLLGQYGTPQDYSRGINLLQFAAETADENSPQGAYVYGMLLARELPNVTIPDQYIPYDMLTAAKMFIEKAAYLGFAKAQLKMGLAYELCQLGCDFDPALSIHYNALAARQGEAAAEMAISKWFLCGYEGIFEKNEELAFTYAQRAAATQFPIAEFAIGYFYEIGMYVPSDLSESERWYQKAAEHGNADALVRINSIKANNVFSKKDHEQIAVNRIKSRYGSQRVDRRERFSESQPPPLPIHEGKNIDSQNPKISSPNTPTFQNSRVKPHMRPEFIESRNSYPSSGHAGNNDPRLTSPNSVDSPMASPKNTSNRPTSIAPYPLDDVETSGYSHCRRTSSDIGLQNDRPKSAFAIRVHNNIKMTDDFSRAKINVDSMCTPSESAGRASSAGSMGSPGDWTGTSGWEAPEWTDYRAPTDHNPNTQSRPYDFNHRMQNSAPMNPKKPRPPHPDDYYGRQSAFNHDPALARRDSPSNHLIRPERVSSANPQQLPQNPARMTQRPQQNPSSQIAQPRKDSKPSAKPLPSAPAAAVPPKQKKTGPATFEEMGIPAANKEGECCVM